MKGSKTTVLAFVNIALVIGGILLFMFEKITHDELITFMVTVTSIITSMIGYFTNDEKKDNDDTSGTDNTGIM